MEQEKKIYPREAESPCGPHGGNAQGASSVQQMGRRQRNKRTRASAFNGAQSRVQSKGVRGFLWCFRMSLGHRQVRARRGTCGRARLVTLVHIAACLLRFLVLSPSPILSESFRSFLSVVPSRSILILTLAPVLQGSPGWSVTCASRVTSCCGLLAFTSYSYSPFSETGSLRARPVPRLASRAFPWLTYWLC